MYVYMCMHPCISFMQIHIKEELVQVTKTLYKETSSAVLLNDQISVFFSTILKYLKVVPFVPTFQPVPWKLIDEKIQFIISLKSKNKW